MNRIINRLLGGQRAASKLSTDLFQAYQQKNYPELRGALRTLAGMGPQEFLSCKQDGFTLLHHCVFENDDKAFGLVMEQFGTDVEVLEYGENDVSIGKLILLAELSLYVLVRMDASDVCGAQWTP